MTKLMQDALVEKMFSIFPRVAYKKYKNDNIT